MKLFCFTLCRVAFERDPSGEARLLCFANGTGSGGGSGSTPEANPNPVNAPPPQETPRGSGVDQNLNDTRSAAVHAVESGPRSAAREALRDVEALARRMDDLSQSLAKMDAAAKAALRDRPDLLQSWTDVENFIAMHRASVHVMRAHASQLLDWERGDVAPVAFARWLIDTGLQRKYPPAQRAHLSEEDQRQQRFLEAVQRGIAAVQQSGDAFGRSPNDWQTMNQSSRQTAVETVDAQEVLREDGNVTNVKDVVQFLLKDIKDQTGIWKQTLDASGIDKIISEVAKTIPPKSSGGGGGMFQSLREGFGNAKKTLGIEFYSINEVIKAFKDVIDAYKDSYNQRMQLNAAKLAKGIGSIFGVLLPWGGADIPPILERNLEERNEGVKSKYAETLKGSNASFRDLFDPGGELERNRHDGNRARGVLDYAAHRGWLYDIDKHTLAGDGKQGITLTNGTVLSFYDLCPGDWSDTRKANELSKLVTAQGSGKKEERQKYHDRYFNINRTDEFIKLMREQLYEGNIWGALGIAERSIKRGLWGHVAEWHTIELIRAIQMDPLVRRCVTQDFIDQFGNLTLYNTFGRWTGSVTKLLRNEWPEAMKKSIERGEEMMDLRSIQKEGRTPLSIDVFLRAQTELERAYGKSYTSFNGEERHTFDENVAKFLCGHVVKVNGRKINIFTEDFQDFTAVDLGQGQMKVDEEDEDYFRNGKDGQPSVSTTTADTEVFNQIFRVNGQGDFTNDVRAKWAADSVITQIEDYRNEGMHDEAREFVEITQAKMNAWYRGAVTDARANKASTHRMIRSLRHRTPFVLLEFVRNRLVNFESLRYGLTQNGKGLSINMFALCKKYMEDPQESRKFDPDLRREFTAVYQSLNQEDQNQIQKVLQTLGG